jgi:hypothetical protein
MSGSKGLAAVLLAAGTAFAVAGGCSNMQISSDYDPGVDFSRLGSYGWLPDPRPPTGDPRLDSSLLDGRIRSAVKAQLAARGYREVSPDQADFLVTYHVALESKLDVDTMYRSYGYGWGRGYGPVELDTVVREYEQGTLLLDFVDPETRNLIWRGSASAEITPDSTPERRQERVNRAVAGMLERFPPR